MKIGKGILQVILLFVEIILVLVIFVAFAIRTSTFQSYLGKQTTQYLSKKIGKKIDIDKIDIIFFDRLELKGIFAEDKNGDTLLFAENIEVNINNLDLEKGYFDIENVKLANATVNLNQQKGDSTLNFQHLIDFFSTDNQDTTSSEFSIDVREISLENVNFRYDDFNTLPVESGIDYAHLSIRNLNGEFSDFNFKDNLIATNINGLSFKDHSGVIVKNFSSYAEYSPEKISLKQLNIVLENSNVEAAYFELITENGTEDFNDFLNQVKFNSKLTDTKIALTDLAYFVPNLQGMTDEITISNIDVTGAVNGMRIKNADISMLTHTKIQGDFQIPNLEEMNSASLNERITLFQTSVRDIERLNLSPFLKGENNLKIPNNLKGLDVITLRNGHFTGFITDFVVDGAITTGLGNLYTENGLKFKKGSDGLYHYQGALDKTLAKDVIVENLKLDQITSNSNLGTVNGFVQILPGSKGFSAKDINLLFEGRFESVELNNYTYNNIEIKNGKYNNEKFDGAIDIVDDNLALNYVGYVDFKDELKFNFDVAIDSSFLSRMNLMPGDLATNLKTKLNVNLTGSTLEDIKGDVTIEDLSYFDGENEFCVSDVALKIKRTDNKDVVIINSSYFDGELEGQFNFSYLYPSLKNQLANLIPNLLDHEELPDDLVEDYRAQLRLKDVNPLLDFFGEGYFVDASTQVELIHSTNTKKTDIQLISDKIGYDGMEFKGINLKNKIDSLEGDLYYEIKLMKLNDSITVDNFGFNSLIKNNKLSTTLGWDANNHLNPALFAFETELKENQDILTHFSPSFFHLKDSEWNIESKSELLWNPDHIEVNNLDIKSSNHLISLNGKVSKNPNDWLNILVKDFDLSELNGFLGGELSLNGILNLDGKVADLYNDMKFVSHTKISDLKVNNELVGNINLDGNWDQLNKAVDINGSLIRNESKKFDFYGQYYVERKKNSLDMKLDFDHMDIGFLNAFSDPELYTDIRGKVDGNLLIKGEPDNPIIIGDLTVEQCRVNVPMFNVDYVINGPLNFAKGEIIADYLELSDELGNMGIGMMQIYHTNYGEWNYDVTLDLDDPNITKTFLAMNTFYKDGAVYYGKAFVTGNINIFGYGGLTEIGVDLKTEKGTDLTLPLYGTSEIEENSFVKFYSADTSVKVDNKVEIDRLGMTLNMNFEITEQAKVNIVFDPILNDMIEAKGVGNIEMNMDDYGDIEMFGKYTINEGFYNFNMKNVVTEQFEIMRGSSLIWTQSPYDAKIDIKTRFRRNVDMGDIMTSGIKSNGKKDLVYGYLNLDNTLLNPNLGFDIEAPLAKDEAKNALNQIRAIDDDLNRQFFSLLLLKKFIPVEGAVGSSGTNNVTEDLVNQQINAVLGQIGENYNLNSNIGSGHAELGFSTSFLDDKLKITSSVGIISSEGDDSKGSNLVGDVNIEYELNEDGTFTVNVFNASNDDAANQDQGAFTQGLGLSYQETFNSRKDFKLWQGFLDVFRKKEKKQKEKRNNNGRKVPIEGDFRPTEYIEE